MTLNCDWRTCLETSTNHVLKHFTISHFSWKLPQILRTTFYEIIAHRLGFHHTSVQTKYPKQLSDWHSLSVTLKFLERTMLKKLTNISTCLILREGVKFMNGSKKQWIQSLNKKPNISDKYYQTKRITSGYSPNILGLQRNFADWIHRICNYNKVKSLLWNSDWISFGELSKTNNVKCSWTMFFSCSYLQLTIDRTEALLKWFKCEILNARLTSQTYWIISIFLPQWISDWLPSVLKPKWEACGSSPLQVGILVTLFFYEGETWAGAMVQRFLKVDGKYEEK